MKFVLQFQCDCEITVGDNFVVCSFWQFILDIDEEVSLRPSSPHYAHKLPPSVHTSFGVQLIGGFQLHVKDNCPNFIKQCFVYLYAVSQ